MVWRDKFSPLRLLLAAAMIAAVALGYTSYRSAVRLAQETEVSIERSNRVLGRSLIKRIEQVIIDTDRAFFRLVRLGDRQEFRELWGRIVRLSPAVESVTVLGKNGRILHLITKLDPDGTRDFRDLFRNRIIADLELGALPSDAHRHLHKRYEKRYYLLSYIRRTTLDQDYVVVLSLDLPYIIREVFPRELGKLAEANTVGIVDEDLIPIWRRPLRGANVFEAPFPTTLYKWRLQIRPSLRSGAITEGVKAKKKTDLVLVFGSVAVIWLGIIVLGAAARKERRANQLKSEFIANVSHELKTPLSLIRMFGELLALGRSESSETHREYAEIIMKESDRLSGLIDNVLDFSRIERGQAAYQMGQGQVAPVVERALDLCRYRTEQAGVELSLEVEGPLPALVFDESAITLLTLNLIENALKYGATAGQQIRVALQAEGEGLLLSVEDDGPGIGEGEKRQIFERFYRGEGARARGQRGSGIGLSLVRHIAEAHQGSVMVESEPGKGARFEVRLPLHHSA
jgi:two-component system phosphate regulon sensor histidine kinase PhoR